MEENITNNPTRQDNSGTLPLIMGILSIIFGVFGLSVVGAVLGIIGIVKGNKARSYNKEANSGFICSIIGTAISCSFLILMLLFAFSFVSFSHLMFLPFFLW